MSEPLFSVVIACYNHEKFIRETVESVLQQSLPSGEVIVVDDASKDGTADILRSFGKSIIFESLSLNGGASAARNRGAAIARGKYLVFLDGDDVLPPWSLQVYSRIIAERASKMILGRSRLFYGDPPAHAGGAGSEIRFVQYETFLDKDRPWVFNSSSLVVERAAFCEVGGWSPDFFYQDIQDLLNKLCVVGRTCMVLTPETVFYRMHATNAVRKVAPFIEGIYRLQAKVKQGAYPGDRAAQAKRSAWFGGLILYWGMEGMRNGLFFQGLKLILAHWWMVLFAVVRRSLSLIAGRRQTEVLVLVPNAVESPVNPHPARLLSGERSQ